MLVAQRFTAEACSVTMLRRLQFSASSALAVEVTDHDDLPHALATLGLTPPRRTVVIVGGAAGLDESGIERLHGTFSVGIGPVLERFDAVAIDGGTLSGVMQLAGEMRVEFGASFPLVGVAAAGTVQLPDRADSSHRDAVLDPHHSHFIIVPGDEWGAESAWISQTATLISGGLPAVTILINGGQIAFSDVEHSVGAGRRVIVIAGSGRTADVLADAAMRRSADDRAQTLVASGLLRVIPIDEPVTLAEELASVLGSN